ncbi:MAG TPA: serine hydrolase [Rhodothermales bacterium]
MKYASVLALLLLTAAVFPDSPNGAGALPRATPESQGIASADILAFVDAADRTIDAMNSFMLVRHGRVVAEGWWTPYDAESPHVLYSLSKSFTSTAVGLAVAEGKLSIHDQVLSFFPEDGPAEPSDNLRAMRVSDLLRMNTGHATEPNVQGSSEPWTRTFLAHEVPFKPGSHFLYNTPATYMLSAIVQKVTGETVFDYLGPRLFEPLGITNPTWGTSPQGVTLGGFGLSVRTEDIARFGQLYLQKGEWNGQQILPAEWVEAATKLQTSNGSNPNGDWDQGYGYQFWRSRYGNYRGDGAFGQYCIVMPEHDAVVAITSGVRDMQAVMNLVWDMLIPAMQDAPLPENPAAHSALTERLENLTLAFVDGRPRTELAESVSGVEYAFTENQRRVGSVALDFEDDGAMLRVTTADGVDEIPVGFGTWKRSRSTFVNGLQQFMQPGEYAVAASGAWTADDTFTVKLSLYETPFYTTMAFRFAGDELILDSEHNVAFGPRERPQLIGHR